MSTARRTTFRSASARPRVLIIGAGLGGLTTAVALLRRGFTVQVYEQAPALTETGAGLTLATTAMRVFDDLELWPQMAAISTRGVSVAFVHYQTGELLHGEFDPEWSRHPETPEQSAHVHRAAAHAVLVDAVRAMDPDAIVLNQRLARVEQDDNGVSAVFESGATAAGDLLIGADGVQSAVYRSVFARDNPATFTGVMAIRCLMPRDERTAPYLTAGRAVNFVGHGRGFHRYGIDDGRVVNCVALARTDAWTEEGWTHRCSREEFMALYQDFHPDVRGLIANAPEASTFKWALRSRAPLQTWTRGRVAVLGDAAHPMLPYLGQGATAAIEDALVLARALDAHDDHALAFAAYEADRLPRATEQMRLSEKQGEALNRGPDRYKNDRPDQTVLSAYDARRAEV